MLKPFSSFVHDYAGLLGAAVDILEHSMRGLIISTAI